MFLLKFCRQYVLLVPSVLQEGSLDKACVQLFNVTEFLVLTVSINYGEVQTEILEEQVTEENVFKCFSFEVPQARLDPVAFITFSAKGGTINLEERRAVAISPRENVVFVQTDKSIYMPGQKGVYTYILLPSANIIYRMFKMIVHNTSSENLLH
ncbi:ovostatin homolog 2-like [Marmota marmota marmota]|uniref:ovostatin homolog 2-like n=1 Tax=Marmota marmota marmota TaxID=9994 RepID=UPI002093E3DC|nr:ovostatin homolog 2-like [Marmota marmota marmota]